MSKPREYISSENYPGHYWLIESEERLVVAYDPPPFQSPTTVHVIEYSAYEQAVRERDESRANHEKDLGRAHRREDKLQEERDRYREALEEIQTLSAGSSEWARAVHAIASEALKADEGE